VRGRALSPLDPNNYQEFDESYTLSDVNDNPLAWGGLAGA
jgi:hypothetical protein